MNINKNIKSNDGISVIGVIVIILIIVLVLSIGPLILMGLWNWLCVDLFGLPIIGYWKAVGLVLLLSFIGGFFKNKSKD